MHDHLPMNVRTYPNKFNSPFNQRITKAIAESRVFAASNALAKHDTMAKFWCTKDLQ